MISNGIKLFEIADSFIYAKSVAVVKRNATYTIPNRVEIESRGQNISCQMTFFTLWSFVQFVLIFFLSIFYSLIRNHSHLFWSPLMRNRKNKKHIEPKINERFEEGYHLLSIAFNGSIHTEINGNCAWPLKIFVQRYKAENWKQIIKLAQFNAESPAVATNAQIHCYTSVQISTIQFYFY